MRTRDLGRLVAIEVEDTGEAIAEAELPHLFDAVSAPLSMRVVHGLVTELGGRIEVERVAPRGTRFRVLLPAAPSPTAPTAHLRVLVVDDDPIVGRCFVRMLGPHHHEATLVSSGAEALAWLEGHTADVVLCDLMMPQMNGLEFLEALEKTGRFPPEQVILMSGGMLAEGAPPALASRSNPRLEKPCDLKQFEALLARHAPKS